MWKRLRVLWAIPVFPAVLILGALMLKFDWVKILLLGSWALGGTILCALLLYPKKKAAAPKGWNQNLRLLRRRVKQIKNQALVRGGNKILTELKQCQNSFPFLSLSARREVGEYYLPTFLQYFTAYATFEECNEGNPNILSAMKAMERTIEKSAEDFHKICDKNQRFAALYFRAQASLLHKKLNEKGTDR